MCDTANQRRKRRKEKKRRAVYAFQRKGKNEKRKRKWVLKASNYYEARRGDAKSGGGKWINSHPWRETERQNHGEHRIVAVVIVIKPSCAVGREARGESGSS